MKKSAFFLFLGVFLFFSLSNKPKTGDYLTAIKEISSQAIQAHMRFLSSDLLFGREPGTQGYEIAANYMVSQFEKLGLEPAGEDSTYFQQVVLSRFNLDFSGSVLAVMKRDETKLLHMEDNYFIYSRYDLEESSDERKMVFSGFGLDYPKQDYFPLGNVDVKGKFIVAMLGFPDFAPESQASGVFEKIERAESLGAKGIILLASPQILSRYSWSRLKYIAGRGFEIKGRNTPQDFFAAVMHHDLAHELTGFTIDSLMSMANSSKFVAFEFDNQLSYHIHTERNETLTKSPNVIARIPGVDPVLKNEFIVYTAHLDHMGIGRPVNGDSIYNGAYDNASGCAILLEIARAFKNLPTPPSRSILFIALTAEEIGLYGSRYFVKYPTVPLQDIVANINIDMVLMEGPLERAVALGQDYIDFGDVVNASAEEIGVVLVPDPLPHERLFMRSDQYSFVQKGIPAVFIINDLTDSLNNNWFKSEYHSPRDEFREDMHFDAGATHARLNFLIGYRISENSRRPGWKSGSQYSRRD
jgi:hypothetical protein